MSAGVELERTLATITTKLNEQQLDGWDRRRVQDIVNEACGGEELLEVDDGGGLHDSSGARVGAVRRTPSGEWITERQNTGADRSDTEIPTPGPKNKLRRLLGALKMGS